MSHLSCFSPGYSDFDPLSGFDPNSFTSDASSAHHRPSFNGGVPPPRAGCSSQSAPGLFDRTYNGDSIMADTINGGSTHAFIQEEPMPMLRKRMKAAGLAKSSFEIVSHCCYCSLQMRAMIAAYQEDKDDNEFKFIHIFARIEGCDKWTETRTALTKAHAKATVYDPGAAPSTASEGHPVGHKKAKAIWDAPPVIEKLHSSIMACMADAATNTAKRAEQVTKVFTAARWASVIERQDIKLGLIMASVAVKKRTEDLAILMVDTRDMDDKVNVWCIDQRALILSESQATLTDNQASTPTPATATQPRLTTRPAHCSTIGNLGGASYRCG